MSDGSALQGFSGFADTRGRFFGELALHNDRGWFEVHRGEYEAGWLAPMRALLAGVRPRLASAYPGQRLGEPKVFRIHRDVRFGRDKTPYKTHVGGLIPVGGPATSRSQVEVPVALYFQVGFDELFAGSGLYGMDPATLARHRRAVVDARRGAELGRLVAGLVRKGWALEARESTKRVPAGLDPEHPRADLLRMKGLVAMAPPLERRLLVRRELVDALARRARAAAPLVRWLLRNAGPGRWMPLATFTCTFTP
jgi:uncharacterized protein (TIGR02453 family)